MKEELSGLTGLRGLLAAAVVGFHYGIPGFGHAWLAVDGFFILSGLVLAHVYRDGLDRGSFVWARFARTLPVHLVTTAAIGDVALRAGYCDWTTVVLALGLVGVVNPPAWSLAVEWNAYLLFAAFMPLSAARRVPAGALIAGGLALSLFGVSFGSGSDNMAINLCRGIGWFAVGVGLYRSGWRPPSVWPLDTRLAVWLGDISYPLYLVHYTPKVLGYGTWIGIPLSLLCAVILHRLVEVPARRWLRALPGRSANVIRSLSLELNKKPGAG